MAVMDKPKLKDHRGRALRTYTATEAKNSLGAVLEDAARYGVVGITKRSQPKFVVLSVEEYAHLQPPAIAELEAEFDRRVAEMQTPKAAAVFRRLFAATPEELAATAHVDPEPPRKRKTRAER